MTEPLGYATPAAARFYTPAARFERVRFVLALPVALALAAVLGGAYAFLQFELSSVYFRVPATCAAAAALGLVTAGLLSFARVHHRALAILLGTLVGLVGLWGSWVAWIHRLFADSGQDLSMWELATSPRLLLDVMRAVNVIGVWRFGGNTYRGGLLTAVWVVEAAILVLGCTLVASRVAKPGLFCPACRKRCTRVPGPLGRFHGEDTSQVKPRVAAGDFDYLLALGPVRDEDDPEVGLELLACPCGQTNVLNVSRIAWEDNGQGGFTVKARPLIEGLLLSPQQVEHVTGLQDRLPAGEARTGDGPDAEVGDDEAADPARGGNGTDNNGEPGEPHDDDPYADRRPPR